MRLRRNQEEVLKLHALGCCARGELDASHLPEREGYCVPQLHAREVDTDAGSCASAEGVEGRLCSGGLRFGWVAFF